AAALIELSFCAAPVSSQPKRKPLSSATIHRFRRARLASYHDREREKRPRATPRHTAARAVARESGISLATDAGGTAVASRRRSEIRFGPVATRYPPPPTGTGHAVRRESRGLDGTIED